MVEAAGHKPKPASYKLTYEQADFSSFLIKAFTSKLGGPLLDRRAGYSSEVTLPSKTLFNSPPFRDH
jgi:hypothetical protein